MFQKNHSGIQELSEAITSDDILGKDVIDSEGSILGLVDKLFINKETMEVIGISIDKGFLKSNIEIGKGYVSRITPHAVFLSIRPALNLKGKLVFDRHGNKIGRVVDVNMHGNSNHAESVVIRPQRFWKKFSVPYSDIKTVGYSIFLNRDKSTILEKIKKKAE